jgi:hypothetical protein
MGIEQSTKILRDLNGRLLESKRKVWICCAQEFRDVIQLQAAPLPVAADEVGTGIPAPNFLVAGSRRTDLVVKMIGYLQQIACRPIRDKRSDVRDASFLKVRPKRRIGLFH